MNHVDSGHGFQQFAGTVGAAPIAAGRVVNWVWARLCIAKDSLLLLAAARAEIRIANGQSAPAKQGYT